MHRQQPFLGRPATIRDRRKGRRHSNNWRALPRAATPKRKTSEVMLDYAEKQDTKAVYRTERAAARGGADAQDNLGTFYTHGLSVPKDYAKAAYWFQKSAAQGFSHGEDDLGESYAHGRGVPQNYAKAIYWLKKAAAQGNPTAQRDLQTTEAEYRTQQRSHTKPSR